MRKYISIFFLCLSLSSHLSSASPSGCGGDKELTATTEPQYIESPGYPSEYPSDLSCSWVITNGGSEPISLTFSDPFWLETGFTHCYDYLRITNSRTGESWDLCGEDVPSDLNLDTDKVEVTLFTDFANNHEGFRMTYQTSGEMNTTPSPTTPGSTTEGPSTSEGTTDGGPTSPGPQKFCGYPAIRPDWPMEEEARSGIINGVMTVPHSWPWQVSIQGQSARAGHYCGGSLLSPNWVLTAAHCANLVFIGTYSGDQVVVGQYDRREGDKQTIKIGAKFMHPDYDNPDRDNDIALLRLDEPARLGDTASPPCLPKSGDFGDSSSFGPGQVCALTGWGKVGDSEAVAGDNFNQPWKLRQTAVPLVSDQDCRDIYLEGAGFTIQDKMQCAGGDGHGGCNGDSGGPLVCLQDDGHWYQVGIVSFGPAPCDATIPGVYTRVAGHIDWLADTIAANGGW